MRRNSMAATAATAAPEAAPHPVKPLIIRTDGGGTPSSPPPPRAAAIVKAYIALTKPRIVELLLITTIPAMLLAARVDYDGLPPFLTVLATVVGGAFAAGAANAINCYLDRDIDPLMRRTSRRPIPQHTVPARNALIFGLVLGVASVAVIWVTTNALAALLTLAAIAYYDIVYTMWLKRTTAANTAWGGVCGAAPVLIGWAAVTGSLSWEAWILFAVVFLWQPPHFFALAIKYKDDYAAAGVPMLPVVASARRVGLECVVWSWLMVAASVALWPLATTPLYGLTALVCGVLFCLEAHRLHGRARRGEDLKPMRLFHWSTSYLTLVFVALAIDTFLV